MLAGHMGHGLVESEPERPGPPGLIRDADDGRGLPPCGRLGDHDSVALIALLEPGIAPVVVAVLLPEARLVVVRRLDPALDKATQALRLYDSHEETLAAI